MPNVSAPAPPTTVLAPVVRELPAEDWHRLSTLVPFDIGGLPDPLQWRIIVAEEGGPGGKIVAYCGLWTAIHCEPTWFDPSVRHHPKLFMDLWRTVREVVEGVGGQMVFATIDDDRPDLQTLWEKFGFVGAPGRLYLGELSRMP